MNIPLFPLHTVLAPGIALPLHVFEERYRVMVRRCIDTASPFGIVLIREGSEVAPHDPGEHRLAIAGVGTFAEIREAGRLADGRWNLLVVGGGRFVVRDVDPDQEPYLVATVDPLVDESGNRAVTEALVGRVTRRFVDYLRLLRPRDGEAAQPLDVQVEMEVAQPDASAVSPGFGDIGDNGVQGDDADTAGSLQIPDDPSVLSLLLTGILQVEPDRKQALLEATSAEARLRGIDRLLDRELLLLALRLAPFAPDRRTSLASRS